MNTVILTLKKLIIVFSLIWIVAPQVRAEEPEGGLFVEPSINSETGQNSVSYPTPLSNSSGNSEGFGLGARIGFHLSEAFFLGVDGRYSMPQFKDSSVNYDARAVSTNYGPVVGVQMPIVGLRLWGSYILGGDLNPEESEGFDVRFRDASGYRVGAGFRLAAVSLNLEYQEQKYGQSNLEQVGTFSFAPGSTIDSVELESKTWLASLSFPLEL